MISIIIPAYNEAKVIGRCLSALMQQDRHPENFSSKDNSVGINDDSKLSEHISDEIEIIVVCNGCTDNTVDVVTQVVTQVVAKQAVPTVNIIAIEQASKTAAINLGLEQCRYDTVVLLDADIVFTASDLDKMLEQMKQTKALIASPKAHIDLTGASYWVKAYYDVTEKLPYYQSRKISAVIILTKEAKERLGTIPELIADDRYIQLQFKPEEQLVVDELTYRIKPPSNVSDLIKILTRSHLGNMELVQKFPEFNNQVYAGHEKLLFNLIRGRSQSDSKSHFDSDPCKISSIIVFIIIKLIVRVRAKFKFRNISQYQWEKDESSR